MELTTNILGVITLILNSGIFGYLYWRSNRNRTSIEKPKNWRERPYKEPQNEEYITRLPGHCIKEYEMVDGTKKYYAIIHLEKHPGFFQSFPLQNMVGINKYIPFESLEEAKKEIEEYLVRWRKATVSKVTIIENVKPV